jgi:geranylgeranyl transferase type-1 subunit beta
MSSPDHSTFHKDRHIKYWLRCLKTYLPTPYTSQDSNRMTLAFFTLSALDLLGVLHEKTTPSERQEYIDWIYRCQHPSGGFRSFTGTIFNAANSNEGNGNGQWDPAHLAGTFFALASLAVLGDGFERVRRVEGLMWLRKLQCGDGSFGELLMEGERIEGGADVRFCYLAAVVRWMLRGVGDDSFAMGAGVEDIDVDALVAFVVASQVRKLIEIR